MILRCAEQLTEEVATIQSGSLPLWEIRVGTQDLPDADRLVAHVDAEAHAAASEGAFILHDVYAEARLLVEGTGEAIDRLVDTLCAEGYMVFDVRRLRRAPALTNAR